MKLRRHVDQMRSDIMKLPLIAASILAYILLATAWICYATDPLNRVF